MAVTVKMGLRFDYCHFLGTEELREMTTKIISDVWTPFVKFNRNQICIWIQS